MTLRPNRRSKQVLCITRKVTNLLFSHRAVKARSESRPSVIWVDPESFNGHWIVNRNFIGKKEKRRLEKELENEKKEKRNVENSFKEGKDKL